MSSSIWHQYNFEPIQGWQMFRTASMAWETYNLKNAHGKAQRSKQEESESTISYFHRTTLTTYRS